MTKNPLRFQQMEEHLKRVNEGVTIAKNIIECNDWFCAIYDAFVDCSATFQQIVETPEQKRALALEAIGYAMAKLHRTDQQEVRVEISSMPGVEWVVVNFQLQYAGEKLGAGGGDFFKPVLAAYRADNGISTYIPYDQITHIKQGNKDWSHDNPDGNIPALPQ